MSASEYPNKYDTLTQKMNTQESKERKFEEKNVYVVVFAFLL